MAKTLLYPQCVPCVCNTIRRASPKTLCDSVSGPRTAYVCTRRMVMWLKRRATTNLNNMSRLKEFRYTTKLNTKAKFILSSQPKGIPPL